MDESTGIPAVDTLVLWAIAAVAIAGGIGLLWRLTRGVRRIMGKVDDFVDDWNGAPPRPGVPARPGVMARLGGIEDRVGAIEYQLHPNSGTSLRDAVDRVEAGMNGTPPGA